MPFGLTNAEADALFISFVAALLAQLTSAQLSSIR